MSWLVKTYVPNYLLAKWFNKSLFYPIKEDVAKGGVVTEEKFIPHSQYLDLVYTQSGMLYDKIPNALRPSSIFPPPPGKKYHVIDGVICSSNLKSVSKPFGISLTASA